MIIIKPPLAIWMQISSFSFFMAGNFSDLLVIRLFLSSAYIFLFTNSILGGPIWPLWRLPDHLQLDGVFWAVLNLYVHVSTVVRLLLDERPVQLRNEALWRMFYRTGGLSKKLFQRSIDPYCEEVTYNENDVIPIDDEFGNRKWFYIIYKGQVTLNVVALAESDQKNAWKKEERKILYSTTRIAQSGQLFDFRSLGFLRDSSSIIAQNQQHKHKLHSAKALSDTVVLFRFPANLMANKIASDPTTRLMWKELLMENLLRIVQRHFYNAKQERLVSRHVSGSTHDNNGNDAINPAFWPLETWEEPEALRAGSGKAWRNIIRHVVKSMQWSFTPPWPLKGFPVGLRHKIYLQAPVPLEEGAENHLRKPVAFENGDAEESQSLVQSEPSSVEYQSIGSFRQEDDFLEYLDEMDEATGLGLNISFLVNSHHGSENSDINMKKREEQRS